MEVSLTLNYYPEVLLFHLLILFILCSSGLKVQLNGLKSWF
jgi:hypothetical protein